MLPWRHKMRIKSYAVLFVALVVAGLLAADESRIPIYAPTTISAPRDYYLTRDINTSNGAAITIAASNVTLDLNGHILTGNLGNTGVYNSASVSGIHITNGRIQNFDTGIYVSVSNYS